LKRKPKRAARKRGRGTEVLEIFIFLGLLLVLYVAVMQSRVPSSTSTSSVRSLGVNDFEVSSFTQSCTSNPQTGKFGLGVTFQLTDNNSLPFHLQSATIVLDGISLSNGTSITINQQQISTNSLVSPSSDNLAAQFSTNFVVLGNVTLSHAFFTITSSISEVPMPVEVYFRTMGCQLG